MHVVAGQILDRAELQIKRIDEFFHPQQFEIIEYAFIAEAGTVHDDMRDPHLLGKLQVFFR